MSAVLLVVAFQMTLYLLDIVQTRQQLERWSNQ